MKAIKNVIILIVLIIFVWGVISVARPYWKKYWLQEYMESAAVYGTKHSISETRKMLTSKVKKEGYDFKSKDFTIHKDENNAVSIRIKYTDEIDIFGTTIKKLEFDVKTKAYEIKEAF